MDYKTAGIFGAVFAVLHYSYHTYFGLDVLGVTVAVFVTYIVLHELNEKALKKKWFYKFTGEK